jgi:hypothetical protein
MEKFSNEIPSLLLLHAKKYPSSHIFGDSIT